VSKGRRRQKGKSAPSSREPGLFVPATEPRYIELTKGPATFVHRISGAIQDKTKGIVTVKAIPLADWIRPVELRFEPPLQSFGSSQKGFDYHWQQLTYLFELDDPKKFSPLHAVLTVDEGERLRRYLATCRALAGYRLINDDHSFNMYHAKGEETDSLKVTLPTHEEFSGFSATFRQVHNDGEPASFIKTWKLLNKALNEASITHEERMEHRRIIKDWKTARNALKLNAAATLIAEKSVPNLKPDSPRPLKGIVPEDLIQRYNYGDTLHWGDKRGELAELMNGDPFHASFYKYCCTCTMTSLSHLYFGFAELVAAALGENAHVGTAKT
jgi:hypothetical protein